MGLDTVELAMEVEDVFGITILDGQACQMSKVGDLYSFILGEIQEQRHAPNTCVTAATFYELRQRLHPYIEDAKSIRPRSFIDATLPRKSRRLVWKQISRDMNLEFPSLVCPLTVDLIAFLVVAGLVTVSFISFASLNSPILCLIVTGVTFAMSYWLARIATSPFAVLPSKSFETYRGLVTQLVARNHGRLSWRYHTWNPADVWNVLQVTIAEQLGVKVEDVTPNSHFIDDLGCD